MNQGTMGLSLSKGYTFSEMMLGMVGEDEDPWFPRQDSSDTKFHAPPCRQYGSKEVPQMYSILEEGPYGVP